MGIYYVNEEFKLIPVAGSIHDKNDKSTTKLSSIKNEHKLDINKIHRETENCISIDEYCIKSCLLAAYPFINISVEDSHSVVRVKISINTDKKHDLYYWYHRRYDNPIIDNKEYLSDFITDTIIAIHNDLESIHFYDQLPRTSTETKTDICNAIQDGKIADGTSLNDFSYRVNNGLPEYSIDGGTTWNTHEVMEWMNNTPEPSCRAIN